MPKTVAKKSLVKKTEKPREATTPSSVKKVIVQTTILVENDVDVSKMSLAEIDALIDTGEGIGAVKVVSEKPVKTNRLVRELRAIGNDGTFFDHLTVEDD